MAPDGHGYGFEPEALPLVAGRLRSGTAYLDLATGTAPSAVDAGASSDIVNAALAMVQQAGVVLSQVLEDTASKVDSADGSYADVENTVEGYWTYREKYLTGGGSESPLEQAPQSEREVTSMPKPPASPGG